MAQDYYPDRKYQNSSIVPSGPSNIYDRERRAYIACRVVGGGFFDGAIAQVWNKVTAGTNDCAPNPDQHWCVVVGDYSHQLHVTSLHAGHVYYVNEKFDPHKGGWKTFPISTTTYNDVAICNAAVEVLNGMPETYHLLHNNCHIFTLRLLDRIIQDGRRVQMQGNRTFAMQKSPEMGLAPSTLIFLGC